LSVEVPNVVGQSYEDGSLKLSDANLEPHKLTEASTSVPEGVILRTDPGPGIKVAPGYEVKVYVSLGITPVTVPDVSNMSKADAIAALEAKHLAFGTATTDYSPDVKKGYVISSDPEGGS